MIRYQIPFVNNISLKVYDLTGRLMETLVNENQKPGIYQIQWEGKDQANGVYFYRLTTGGLDELSPYTVTKKMILLR